MRELVLGLATAVVATTLSAVSLAEPASAASSTFHDMSGDASHGGDLRSVRVVNGAKNLRVTITMRDLVPDPASGVGGALFVDTDGRRGPEYVAVGGFFDGTDYALLRTDSWKLREATERVECSYRMRLNYQKDTVRFRIGSGCFNAVPGSGVVRVEVRTSGPGAKSADWLGAARTFSKPVARG
jgi:hypothetical protein